jgi:hypothetical protein
MARRLGRNQRLLLEQLWTLQEASAGGACPISLLLPAQRTGYQHRSLVRALALLVDGGLLVRSRRKDTDLVRLADAAFQELGALKARHGVDAWPWRRPFRIRPHVSGSAPGKVGIREGGRAASSDTSSP